MPLADCPECHGTGWKIVEREEISGALPCSCGDAGRAQLIEERAQIPPLYQNASLDNFKAPDRDLRNVLLLVTRFVREFPTDKRPGLLLLGDPGTGKTHLAVGALRALIARGFEGLFFDYQNLLDRIRSSYNEAAGITDREAYRTAMDADLLMLDDLGAHRVTDWVEDTVTSIITHRCNNRKPLIATSNLVDPETSDWTRPTPGAKVDYRITLAERLGPRARSRLFEMCRVVKMPAVEDYRLRKMAL